MKLLLPPKYLCKKIYKQLNYFYDKNKNNKKTLVERNVFNNAIKIFCNFYQIPVPKIFFKRRYRRKTQVGECNENGKISIIYPHAHFKYKYDCNWCGIVYHELAHYYLWAYAEEKALEFEMKMLKRR